LRQYQQLEKELQMCSGALSLMRKSLLERMGGGGPGRIEPGPLNVAAIFEDTGFTTRDENDEPRPIMKRRLLVFKHAGEDAA
jgi:hypothetical protein